MNAVPESIPRPYEARPKSASIGQLSCTTRPETNAQSELQRSLQPTKAEEHLGAARQPKERSLGEKRKRTGGEKKGTKTITRKVLENVAIAQTTNAPQAQAPAAVTQPAGPKQKRTRSKKTAPKAPKEVLASPERANVYFRQQTFEFGSSSQLAREKPLEENEYTAHPSHGDKHEKKSRLWGAAARHDDERVTPAETNNRINTPLEPQNFATSPTGVVTSAYYNLPVAHKSRSRVRHSNQMSILQVIPPNSAPRAAYSLHTVAKKVETGLDPSGQGLVEHIGSALKNELRSVIEPVPPQVDGPNERPINVLTSPSRDNISDTSKPDIAAAKHESNMKKKTTPSAQPAEFQHIDEIHDSGSEGRLTDVLPPSSPLEPEGVLHQAPEATSVAPATSRQKAAIYRISAEEAAREAIIFPFITASVKDHAHGSSSGRSDHQRHPTWWEKMLLYDPIVIEDLTAWINSGVLDETRLKAELRMDEDEVLRVPFRTVQRWCELNSVCCIWREGLGGGVKYQY